MIYGILGFAFVTLMLAVIVLLFQFNHRKLRKRVVIISAVILVLSFAVAGSSQAFLQRILVNSAVIERNGMLVRVSPYYSEEYLRSLCGKEYYIAPNGIDSMFAQLVSKITKSSPYMK